MKSTKPAGGERLPVQQTVESVPALAPRRALFWSLAGLTLLWIIALFLMYWFTVRPERIAPPVAPIHLPATGP
jgi:hypothetical protein